MMTIIIALLVGLFTLFIQVKHYLEFKKNLAIIQEERKMEFEKKGMHPIWYLIQVAFIISGIVSIILDPQNEINIALGIVLVLFPISTYFSHLCKRQLFYNNDGFFYQDKFIRYRSVKEFVRKPASPGIIHVVTFQHESCPMPRANAAIIQQHLNLKKEK